MLNKKLEAAAKKKTEQAAKKKAKLEAAAKKKAEQAAKKKAEQAAKKKAKLEAAAKKKAEQAAKKKSEKEAIAKKKTECKEKKMIYNPKTKDCRERKKREKKNKKPVKKSPKKSPKKKSPKKEKKKPAKQAKPKIITNYWAVPDIVKTKIKIAADKIQTFPNKKINLSKNWSKLTIKKDRLFFRGEPTTRTNTLLKNMKSGQINPTWYTDVLSNSVQYLPSKAGKTKGGTLYAYALKKDLILFNLYSSENFNQLYNMFYNKENNTYDNGYYWMRQNKTGTNSVSKQAKIRTGKHMTSILTKIFIQGRLLGVGKCINHKSVDYNSELCQRIREGTVTINDLNRGSDPDDDFILAEWLCNNGFDGWIQPGDMKSNIPPEIMICSPKDSLKLIADIHYPKGVGTKKGETGKKNKYKGVTTAVKFLRSKNINDNKYYQDYDKEKRQKIREMKNPENL